MRRWPDPEPSPQGQSRNPGGQPKAARDVIEAARQHTPAAAARLAHGMQSDDPRASVAACQALLDRAWGNPMRPAETLGADGKPTEPGRPVFVVQIVG